MVSSLLIYYPLTNSSFSFCIFNGCLTFYVIAMGSDAEKHFLADYV